MQISILPLLVILLAPLTLAEEPPTTLEITPISPVPTCTRPTKSGDTVDMHYRGTLFSDGTQFDASYDRGTPLNFKLGAGRVIKGWDEGLLNMCIGEKRKLVIPPDMAYGKRAMGPIPAGSTLVFETELVGIKGVAKDEL